MKTTATIHHQPARRRLLVKRDLLETSGWDAACGRMRDKWMQAKSDVRGEGAAHGDRVGIQRVAVSSEGEYSLAGLMAGGPMPVGGGCWWREEYGRLGP
jgi:hypothetical protein